MASHYATRAPVIAVAAGELAATVARAKGTIGVLGRASDLGGLSGAHVAPLPDDLEEAARRLYAALRDLDSAGVDVIVAVLPPEVGLGAAIADRLRRAAAPRET